MPIKKTLSKYANYLPGLSESYPAISPPGLDKLFSYPALTPSALEKVIYTILNSRNQYLANKPLNEIIYVLDKTSRIWLDSKSFWRNEAIKYLTLSTIFSKEMVESAIDATFSALLQKPLEELVSLELGDASLLDSFCRLSSIKQASFKKQASSCKQVSIIKGYGPAIKGYGPSIIFHVFSGNIPGIAVRSLAYGIMVKAANLGKMASGEPVLASLFAFSLRAVDPELASSIAVTWWPHEENTLLEKAVSLADDVVAYGNDDTLAAIASKLPLGVRYHPHGDKLSFIVIGKEVLSLNFVKDIAIKIARDVSLYEQMGCFSPQFVYLEDGGEVAPIEFAKFLGEALEEIKKKLPKGKFAPDIAAKISQLRKYYSLKRAASKDATSNSVPLKMQFVLESNNSTDWTVVFDDDPKPSPFCCNRFIILKPVTHISSITETLSYFKNKISTVGYAVSESRIKEVASYFAPLGAHRIVPAGQMQSPPSHWRHDGRFNLLDFLRFVELG